MLEFKSYESFLVFSSKIDVKHLNLLSFYYKEKLKRWGGRNIKSKLYFLNSKYISILGLKENLLFCLKITFNLLPSNILFFKKLLQINSKLKKFLILLK